MASYIALKKFDVGKEHYEPGDEVNTSRWPFRRDVLLEGQRFIKRAVPRTRGYFTTRDLLVDGTPYKKGERINHSALPIEKLEQLVEQRMLVAVDPVPPPRMAAEADGKGR